MKKILLLLTYVFISFLSYSQSELGGIPHIRGTVTCVLPIGDIVYIGGNFDTVAGQPRTNLASFNIRTGEITSWNPNLDGNVTSLTKVGNKLVVGGYFWYVESQLHYFTCLFDLATGTVENNFKDHGNEASYRQGIGADGDDFYFAKVLNGSVFLARANATTGTTSGWKSNFTFYGDVNTILATDSYVYMGGKYTFDSVKLSEYSNLCRFTKTDGALDTSWHPKTNGMVISMVQNTNKHIFLAGYFNSIHGKTRQGLAELDENGNLANFMPTNSSTQNYAAVPIGNYLWVGGNSYILGGLEKWRLAEINISSQVATCWDMSSLTKNWSACHYISVVGDTVYATDGIKLHVFTGSPRPHPAANAITGPSLASPQQTCTYRMPYVAGHSYTWSIIGGTGTSFSDSIRVTWGSGIAGTVKAIENNLDLPNCNGDTIYLQVSLLTTAVNDISEASFINVAPNPTKGKVTIHTNADNDYCEIYDISGKLLMSVEANSSIFDIETSSLAKRLYFISVVQKNNRRLFTRLIKE